VRVRALAGVAGPVAFTAAWVAASLRQTGHGAVSVQLSGLAAPDARDPWIMIGGFLVLGGCTVWFGEELARDVGGPAPRLIQGAGVLTVAAGLLRRDHMQLTSGPVSWHNEAHNVVSLVLYLDLVLAQLLLARRFGAIPLWRPWRRYLLASGIATAVALAVFLPNTTSPSAGLLQRIAVTIPLAAMTAVAARLAGLAGLDRLDTGSKAVDGPSTAIEGGRWAIDYVPRRARKPAHWSWIRRWRYQEK
jgi:hypothetical membrane protein